MEDEAEEERGQRHLSIHSVCSNSFLTNTTGRSSLGCPSSAGAAFDVVKVTDFDGEFLGAMPKPGAKAGEGRGVRWFVSSFPSKSFSDFWCCSYLLGYFLSCLRIVRFGCFGKSRELQGSCSSFLCECGCGPGKKKRREGPTCPG